MLIATSGLTGDAVITWLSAHRATGSVATRHCRATSRFQSTDARLLRDVPHPLGRRALAASDRGAGMARTQRKASGRSVRCAPPDSGGSNNAMIAALSVFIVVACLKVVEQLFQESRFSPVFTQIEHFGRTCGRCRPNLVGNFRPNSVDLGNRLVDFDQLWPTPTKLWLNPAKVGRQLPNSGPSWPTSDNSGPRRPTRTWTESPTGAAFRYPLRPPWGKNTILR